MLQLDDARLLRPLTSHDGAITRSLAYLPPYDWPAMLRHLTARATPGVELVDAAGRYWRTIQVHGHGGWIAVEPDPDANTHAMRLELSDSLLPVLAPVIARLRRLLDLDADPRTIEAHLAQDPSLAPHVAQRPGLRVAGAADGFELALRAVLGQQVTVRGATTLAARVATLAAEPLADGGPAGLTHLPVSAGRLADMRPAEVASIGLPLARAGCIVGLARAVADGTLPELDGDGSCTDAESFIRRFVTLPGIGPWTAEYVAMRALRWPDAFPAGDLGLRKAMGGLTPAKLRAASERWRPWRAYAAQHLWATL